MVNGERQDYRSETRADMYEWGEIAALL